MCRDAFRGSYFVVFSGFSVWDKHPEYKKGAYLYRFGKMELYLTGNKVTAHTLEHTWLAFQIRLAVSGRKNRDLL